MRKDGTLNNKDRKKYGSLLRKKLLEMGIKDEIVMKATRKVRQVVTMTKDGQLQIQKVPSLMAHNLNRAMMKKFLTMPLPMIKKFLASSVEQIQAVSTKLDEAEAALTEKALEAAPATEGAAQATE